MSYTEKMNNNKKDQFHIDFIGIGTTKAGTSTINRWLKEHPEIQTYPFKETNYFSQSHGNTDYLYRREDFEGYKQLWEQFEEVDFSKITGEISTYHIHDPKKTSDKIKSWFPNAKLILMIRDPVERAFSYYRFEKYKVKKRKIKDFPWAINNIDEVLNHSYIADKLNIYLEDFPREQIKVIFFEDIVNNPENTAKDLFEFLGVNDTNFKPDTLYSTINKTHEFKLKPLVDFQANLFKKYYILKQKNTITGKTLRVLERYHLMKPVIASQLLIRKILAREETTEKLSEKDKEYYYKTYFEKEIDKLEGVLEEDLSNWRHEK